MNILNDRLAQVSGIQYCGNSWNSLFYADDVCLIAKSDVHLQQLLDICESFQADGYVKWNATKSVVVSLTTAKFPDLPELSPVSLNGERLVLKSCTKYLGYYVNQNLSDRDQIEHQARRLYAITNGIKRSIPLRLLDDGRLRKIICAYGGIYMLGALDVYITSCWQKLKNAHRYLAEVVSQYRERSPHYDPGNGLWVRRDTYIYGRLELQKLEQLSKAAVESLNNRFETYIAKISH